MIYLVLSILISSAVYAVFKLFSRFEVRNFQAIVFNYFVAAGFGFAFAFQQGAPLTTGSEPWIGVATIIGVIFIALFYLMAIISQRMGVSVASVAAKMAMVIPVIVFVIIDPSEKLTLYKGLGVLIGVIAVFLVAGKNKNGMPTDKANYILPILLFLGSGTVDVFLAYSEKTYLTTDEAFLSFIAVIFTIAGLIGTFLLLVRIIQKKDRIHGKSILAGAVLGLINYGSIFFLLKTLGSGLLDRSTIFPANNMGIVALSALMGLVLFKEKLSTKNTIGIGLALVAIVVLTLGDIGI